jgi:glycerol dehydrogenase-like iron-containing ADH family enzyme
MKPHQYKHQRASAPKGPAHFFLAPFSPGPARWLAGDGAWEAAAAELAALPQPLGLAGEAGLLKQFRKPLTQAWLEAGVELALLPLPDGVQCCESALQALLKDAKTKGVAGFIGFGGGKALDLAKWAGQEAQLPVVTVPSSLATCAAASTVVVAHDEAGNFREVLDLDRAPVLCVADLAVLRQAPPRLLAAGMADTLAKWLEWRAVQDEPGGFGAAAGWALAEKAALACEAAGADALADPASPAWELCAEACLLWSAQASCLGQAPAAAAHSLANALTKQAAGRTLYHGEQVGLGLLWQAALGAPSWPLERIRACLKAWELPVTLPQGLDMDLLLGQALEAGESVHGLPFEADAGLALQALGVLRGP